MVLFYFTPSPQSSPSRGEEASKSSPNLYQRTCVDTYAPWGEGKIFTMF